jgi:hypothetical protein
MRKRIILAAMARRSSDRLCVVDVHVAQAKNCGYGGGNRSVSPDLAARHEIRFPVS